MDKILSALRFEAQNLSFLNDDQLRVRAEIVARVFERVRLQYTLASGSFPIPGMNVKLPYSCYILTGHECDLDNARSGDRRHVAMEGGGLDRESLLYFSKVAEWATNQIPHLWPDRMIKDLRAPNKHLDTVAEVWWLSKLVGANWGSAQRNVPTNPGNPTSGNFDWRVTMFGSIELNMEVKRRPGEVVRSIHHTPLKALSLFDGADKFAERYSTNTVNVVCIRGSAPINREYRIATKDWLDRHENVSAVCSFAPVTPDSTESFWVLTQPDCGYVRSLFAAPDTEDECYVAPVFFPR